MPGGSFSPASARGLLSALLLGASSIPASSEAVTFADLAGMLIDADIHRSQDVRRDGKSFSIQAHQNWKIAVGADRTIDLTVNTTVNGPRGTQRPRQTPAALRLTSPGQSKAGAAAKAPGASPTERSASSELFHPVLTGLTLSSAAAMLE